MRQLSPPRGVTLIELLIGLVITGILAMAAAPYFVDYINNARLRESGNALLAESLFAQSEALKRNGVVRLNSTGATLEVLDMSGVAPVTLRARPFVDGVTASVTSVDFGSDGMTRPAGTDVSFDIAYTGITCTAEQRCPRLRVEAGGSVRLCGNKLSCS